MSTPPKNLHERKPFWSEAVYSQAGSVIPRRLRKGREAIKWSVENIFAELARVPDNASHIDVPEPPLEIFGLSLAELRERQEVLFARAGQCFETYQRAGKSLQRRQKRSVPILLVAIASWPFPTMDRTADRDRWQKLVIDAAKVRWGDKLRSVVAHVDETFYHLHLVVDDDGRPVKPLHSGFARSTAPGQKDAPRREQARAYKEGGRAAQSWFFEHVGEQMGWKRSEVPRPRISRAAAQRNRQLELEEREINVARSQEASRLREAELEAEAERLRQVNNVLLANAFDVERDRFEVRKRAKSLGAREEALETNKSEEAERLLRRAAVLSAEADDLRRVATAQDAQRRELEVAINDHCHEATNLKSAREAFEIEKAAARKEAADLVRKLVDTVSVVDDQQALQQKLQSHGIDLKEMKRTARKLDLPG